jgi:hypothetical protein
MAALRLAMVLLCVLAGGCMKQWTAQVTQPRLVLGANLEARTSMPLAIVLRDLDTGRYRLTNTAYYVVVSRDRLRFHVTLHHKWDDIADPRSWSAYVEDASGKRHYPEQVTGSVRVVTFYKRRDTTYMLHKPMYRGVADLTVYDRDLFDAGNQLTLVLTRPGYEYRYRWISGPPDA